MQQHGIPILVPLDTSTLLNTYPRHSTPYSLSLTPAPAPGEEGASREGDGAGRDQGGSH